MLLFFKKNFRKRAAAFLLSAIFLYICYSIISSEKDASLIITQISIGKKAATKKFHTVNKVQNIQQVETKKEYSHHSQAFTKPLMSKNRDSKGFNAMTFDIDLVKSSFKKCHENELDIPAYLTGYSELYNFFNVLGSVFGFIASDVKEKIDILENLHTNVDTTHYEQVGSMMNFEIDRNKNKKEELFGSRTLLRLHRALDFTKQFLKELVEMEENSGVSTMAGDVYKRTLANFHPWLIRKAAGLAMYSLPTRKDLIKKIAPDGIEEAVLKEKMETCIQSIDVVYNEIEDLYTKHSLHKLP